MKFGYFIGLNREKRIISRNIKKELMLEDFMVDKKIFNSQDIFLFPHTATPEYREQFVETLRNLMVKKYASFVMTPLIPSLLKIINDNQKEFPELPQLKPVAKCNCCPNTLPEPDGFMGVVTKNSNGNEMLICFECYSKNLKNINE